MKKCIILSQVLFLVWYIYTEQAVTYEVTSGRFGDNLLSYAHAKWIAYKYNLPFLYKPFIYSDRLVLHGQESLYTDEKKESFKNIISLHNEHIIKQLAGLSALLVVPYFPESKWELKTGISFSGGAWHHFRVDWSDNGFIQALKEIVIPCEPFRSMSLPEDRITVAVHVRRGGNYDASGTISGFPLKFLNDDFFISQISNLYNCFNQQPLYVYIFTDDNCPAQIMDKFKMSFIGCDLQFDCRQQGNCDTANVLEDFFALQKFDCLIHSESNFSWLAARLGRHLVSIYPDSFCKINDGIIYDNINVLINYNHPRIKRLDISKMALCDNIKRDAI